MQTDVRRAAAYLERVNLAVIKGAMAARVEKDRGVGDRPAPSLGGGLVSLRVITEPRGDGKLHQVTPLGHQTAVRRDPPILNKLADTDPRRRAARLFADAWEKVRASGGSCLAAGAPSAQPGVPDGGASTRLKHAERVRDAYRITRAEVLGERGLSPVERPVPRVVLAPRRKAPGRKEIRAFDLLVAVCVDGQDMLEILRRHGWGRKAEHRQVLGAALLDMLDDLAAAWGLGRA